MKTNFSTKFKIAKFIITVAALAPGVFLAASAHAESVQASAFCSKIDASASTLGSLISEKEARYSEGKAALGDALEASRKVSDKALYDARVAANQTYAAQFKTLAAQAETSEEKAAVASFKKSVLQAVETRRANVDLAVKNYRAGVDAILATRSDKYASALMNLKASVDQSLKAAKLDCASRSITSAETVIQGARASFQTAIANIDSASIQLGALAETRDTKIDAADAKFSATIETATTKLKAVIGNE